MKHHIYIEPTLARQARDGNTNAFRQLVDLLMKPAYFHALSFLENHEDALEISQEAFTRLWHHRRKIDPDKQLYPWFYTILKRLSMNRRRDRSRKQETASSHVLWIEPRNDKDPYEELLEQERARMIQTALSDLNVNDREILVLKELEGYTYAEISTMLDIPAGTVMSRLYTARKRFKSKMEEVGYEHF